MDPVDSIKATFEVPLIQHGWTFYKSLKKNMDFSIGISSSPMDLLHW